MPLVSPCDELDLRRTCYAHRLNGPDDIVKWVESAGLWPYLDAGGELLAFPRLFLVATRGRG